MIAALYVEKNGVYYGLEDVDPWDEERDSRRSAEHGASSQSEVGGEHP